MRNPRALGVLAAVFAVGGVMAFLPIPGYAGRTCLARQTAKKPGFYATPTRNLTDLSQDKAQGSLYKLLE